ncbi:hypothetical protein [Actinomycetospora aeridis]|uniref:ABC transporter permease n=1 Tax=Actinomycetospora aeridis TaxID=3129231 RepID=A0ABU8NB24_9PSEU
MSAVDDLTELVERAGAAEREALASKWKDRDDVERLRRHVRRVLDDERAAERREPLGHGGDERRLRVRSALLSHDDTAGDDTGGDTGTPVTHAAAARAEADAADAVTVARLALVEAHLAVLDARLARLDAGESAPGAAEVDGHAVLSGRTAVGRHGPALAHGLRGEIAYMLTRRPRTLLKSLAVSLALGLLYLGVIRLFQWDRMAQYLPYLGLWTVSVVMGGAVCLNAMSFDGMRVRAALESGSRLWHLLITKNLALVCLVAPIGFLISALLAWRAGSWEAFLRACALMISFIVLWLGVGNIASVIVPIRDEPIWHRRRDGTLKQFAIVFAVSYVLGYVVNLMLIVRIFAAQEWAERSGIIILPAIFVVLSSITMWVLLTIVAVALSQQPKIRRGLMAELAKDTGDTGDTGDTERRVPQTT